MADIPDALVEKAADAMRRGGGCTPEEIAREALAAVLPDIRAEINREQPDLMRQGYENGVGAMRAALAQVEADLANARRVVAEEIAQAIEQSQSALRVTPVADMAFERAALTAREVGDRP